MYKQVIVIRSDLKMNCLRNACSILFKSAKEQVFEWLINK